MKKAKPENDDFDEQLEIENLRHENAVASIELARLKSKLIPRAVAMKMVDDGFTLIGSRLQKIARETIAKAPKKDRAKIKAALNAWVAREKSTWQTMRADFETKLDQLAAATADGSLEAGG